jgi:hypothetical protein
MRVPVSSDYNAQFQTYLWDCPQTGCGCWCFPNAVREFQLQKTCISANSALINLVIFVVASLPATGTTVKIWQLFFTIYFHSLSLCSPHQTITVIESDNTVNILSLFSLSAMIYTPLSFYSSTSLHVSAAPGHLQVMMSCSTVTLYMFYLFL